MSELGEWSEFECPSDTFGREIQLERDKQNLEFCGLKAYARYEESSSVRTRSKFFVLIALIILF